MRGVLAHSIALAALVTSVLSLPTYNAARSDHPSNGTSANGPPKTVKVVYFQNNDLEKNAIVACKVEPDGSLSNFTTIETGGKGGAGFDGNGTLNGPDALFSQSSVVVKDNFLFAVNAGSNTLSMFSIDEANPMQLTLLGKPACTNGEFPVAVTYSPKLKTACAVNAGRIDGVTCFSADPVKGLTTIDDSPRTLNTGQLTPPKALPRTVSDIFFSHNSKNLLVTVKGNPDLNITGFVEVYPVKGGKVSRECVRSDIAGTPVLFGTIQTGRRTLFATDGTFGSAQLNFNTRTGKVSLKSAHKVDGQFATCWISESKNTGSVYVTDVRMNRIVEFDTKTGKQEGVVPFTNGQGGNIDLSVGEDFLYALSPASDLSMKNQTGVATMKIQTKGVMQEVGTLWIPTEIAGRFAHGMAVF